MKSKFMRLAKYALILGVAVFVAGLTPAHADDITFAVSGQFTDGALLNGSMQIDTSGGGILSGTFLAGIVPFTVTFETLATPGEYAAVFTTPFNPAGDPALVLFVMVGSDGSLSLCTEANAAACGDNSFFTLDGDNVVELATGSLVETPEPATIALLGSGLLALCLLGRKRLALTAAA
jgi:hypothetical protein